MAPAYGDAARGDAELLQLIGPKWSGACGRGFLPPPLLRGREWREVQALTCTSWAVTPTPSIPLSARGREALKAMKTALLALVLIALLVVVLFGALSDWDASAMSVHGWIALTIGTVLSLLVGGGLMALVFYSARHGYDDRIDVDQHEDDKPL